MSQLDDTLEVLEQAVYQPYVIKCEMPDCANRQESDEADSPAEAARQFLNADWGEKLGNVICPQCNAAP